VADGTQSFNWHLARQYAQLVLIAYSVKPRKSYTKTARQRIERAGYEFLTAIYGSDLATDANPFAGETVTFGFVARGKGGELVAVLRGTEGIFEWFKDLEFGWAQNPITGGKGRTEDGFTAIYRSLRVGAARSAKPVVEVIGSAAGAGGVTITGHSLGGALATLLGLDVALNAGVGAPQVYTFASPRVGCGEFREQYDALVPRTYRVFNHTDLVPKQPPLLYAQVGMAQELRELEAQERESFARAHFLETYLALVEEQIGDRRLADQAGSGQPTT